MLRYNTMSGFIFFGICCVRVCYLYHSSNWEIVFVLDLVESAQGGDDDEYNHGEEDGRRAGLGARLRGVLGYLVGSLADELEKENKN